MPHYKDVSELSTFNLMANAADPLEGATKKMADPPVLSRDGRITKDQAAIIKEAFVNEGLGRITATEVLSSWQTPGVSFGLTAAEKAKIGLIAYGSAMTFVPECPKYRVHQDCYEWPDGRWPLDKEGTQDIDTTPSKEFFATERLRFFATPADVVRARALCLENLRRYNIDESTIQEETEWHPGPGTWELTLRAKSSEE